MSRRFVDPVRHPSIAIRRLALVGVGLFGVLMLRQSYERAGAAMEWRISAGVAAMSFALLGTLTEFVRLRDHQSRRPWLFGMPISVAGVISLALAASQDSEWAQGVLLEAGVSLLFLAAVDVLLEATIALAVESERIEREFYDEMALMVAYSFDLSAFQYRTMRYGLDESIALGRGQDERSKMKLLLDFGRKAKDLPVHLDLPKRADFRRGVEKDTRILDLTLDAAARHGLSDIEHRYLTSVIATRADETFRDDPISIEDLPTVVENSAELIVRSRVRGLGRFRDLFISVVDRDPLGASEELAARAGRIRGDPLGALVSDQTQTGDER